MENEKKKLYAYSHSLFLIAEPSQHAKIMPMICNKTTSYSRVQQPANPAKNLDKSDPNPHANEHFRCRFRLHLQLIKTTVRIEDQVVGQSVRAVFLGRRIDAIACRMATSKWTSFFWPICRSINAATFQLEMR